MATLYAWTIPANVIGRFADHTWVTTYDNRLHAYADLGAVIQASERYWMCWGSFHQRGGASGHADGLLRAAPGSLTIADCLVRSNADSVKVPPARGTIQAYGLDGVCHQVANQALFATSSPGHAPISVIGSRGYTKSVYVYGQYGRDVAGWRTKLQACGAGPLPAQDIGSMGNLQDDFIAVARRVLADRDDLLQAVIAMRARHRASLDARAVADSSAEEIDRMHDLHLREVAEIIGRERFVTIFGHQPDDQVNLVEPETYEASRRGGTPRG